MPKATAGVRGETSRKRLALDRHLAPSGRKPAYAGRLPMVDGGKGEFIENK